MSSLSERVDSLSSAKTVPVAELRAVAAEILEGAGLPKAGAARAAEILCDAHLRGIDSHGLMHLPVYVRRLKEGAMNPTAVRRKHGSGAALVIDAQNGLGVLAADAAVAEAAALARQHGIGACAVRNSNHFGAASYFVAWAARQNLVALAFSNAAPTMAPWGGRTPILGTNPLAAAFPRANGEPVVIDMATSAVARARIRAAKAKGESIPEYWALDEHGARTSDPEAALRGTVQPLGGEKGYALTLIIELLCSALAGGRPGFEVVNLHDADRRATGVSHLFIVLDPQHFAGTGRLLEMVDAVAGEIERSEPSEGGKPRLPGQRAAMEINRRLAEGIPVTEGLRDSLQRAVRQMSEPIPEAPRAWMAYQIAVDVGGTFTDGVLLDDATDAIWVAKALTTPRDPGDGIARVIAALLEQLPKKGDPVQGDAYRVVHGTTLISNALVERKGARTALIVTKGMEDALDIRREMRYDTYDLGIEFPRALVDPQDRHAVSERIGPRGEIWTALDAAELERQAIRLRDSGVEAVAVCFLHSCVNDAHERDALRMLREFAPNLAHCVSSEVASEVGEYERMSTVVANAYVQPLVQRYLSMLGSRLKQMGASGRLDIMVSNGGFTEAEVAARYPIRLLESGPAGGVLSAINCASAHGFKRVLAFDMGGTTAKSCVAIDGKPAITHSFEFARVRRFKRGSGLPAVAPSIDLIEIGAGGGSIARVNQLGLLQVGPDSAGSEPGPACYGLGGSDATVTDSDLVLGYLKADNFLGGRMRLDVARATSALQTIGGRIGLTAREVAWGIHDIVNENMAAAARTHIAEQGHDARQFALVATGGAGPVHAVDVARRLRIARVLCPIASGVGSCLGFLAAPARADQSWSKLEPLHEIDRPDLARRMQRAKERIVDDLSYTRTDPAEIVWRTRAEMRYLGQGAQIDVDLGAGDTSDRSPGDLLAAFEAEYVRLYGRTVPGGMPEVVTWRVVGESPSRQRQYGFTTTKDRVSHLPEKTREIFLPRDRKYANVPVHDRYLLEPGARLKGPLVVVEPESTLVVACAASVSVLSSGTVEVLMEGEG